MSTEAGSTARPVWTRGVVVILAVTLAAAVVPRVVLTAQAPAFLVGNDSADYFSAGYSVATGGSLVLPLKRAPLYSLFLAGCIAALGPSLERAVAVQHALGLVTVVLTYVLGALAFSRPVGLVAAALVALNGSLLQMEQLVISEALFTPLLLGALVVYALAVRTARRSLYLATGGCLGLAALTRPAAPALLPVVLLPLLLDRHTIRWRLELAGLALAGMLLLLGPWALYQETVRGTTAFTGGLGDSLYSRVRRYDAGFVFRDAGPPPADPEQARIRARIFDLAQQYQYPREVRRDLQAEFPLTDAQADRALRDVALTVIRQDVGHYVTGTLDMSLDLLKGSDLSLVELWQIRQSARVVQAWPDQLRFALGEPDRWPVASAATVRPLVNLVKDDQTPSRYLVALLPLGMLASLAPARRRIGAVISLVVLSQTLLYVALDGPLFRYRYPLQPLITLLCMAGGQFLLGQIRVLLFWRTCDRRLSDASLK